MYNIICFKCDSDSGDLFYSYQGIMQAFPELSQDLRCKIWPLVIQLYQNIK